MLPCRQLALPSLAALLTAASLASTAPARAQEAELPFHQKQRLVVIFSLANPLTVTSWDGKVVPVLGAGYYRFDAEQRSMNVVTRASFQAGEGAFTQYGSSLRGRVRPLLALPGTTGREVTVRLALSGANFDYPNIVDKGELELVFSVALDSSSSTQVRHKGPVERSGSYVRGTLPSVYAASTAPAIQVQHVKLELEDHLPQVKPIEHFPAGLVAEVRPVPAYDGGHEIAAGPYEFRLQREAAPDALGRVGYANEALFPMVEESDYYGDYRSTPTAGQALVREDGRLWLTFGWGLAGRYHGWSYDLTVSLSEAERATLLAQGELVVQARYAYRYASEDEVVDLATPCQLRLRLAAGSTSSPGSGSSTGTSSGTSSGLTGAVTGN